MGLVGNNVMQISSAASRGYWLQKLFEQSQANPKRQDKIQSVSDNCGTTYLSTSEDLIFLIGIRRSILHQNVLIASP